jgi:hypothetical protein
MHHHSGVDIIYQGAVLLRAFRERMVGQRPRGLFRLLWWGGLPEDPA